MLSLLLKLSKFVLLIILLLLSAGGAFSFYHFFLAPTGIFLKDTHPPVELKRYQLIDMTLDLVIQQNKTE